VNDLLTDLLILYDSDKASLIQVVRTKIINAPDLGLSMGGKTLHINGWKNLK
jgi:hypothetical protein